MKGIELQIRKVKLKTHTQKNYFGKRECRNSNGRPETEDRQRGWRGDNRET